MEQKYRRQEVPAIDPDPLVGLNREQVQQRLAAGWANTVTAVKGRSEKKIVAQHCFTFFNLVFLVLALILLLVGSSVTNFGFLLVVLFNTAIGIVQEIRAKRAVEKLTLLAEQTLKTVRGGEFLELKDRELVRDDIVMFAAGNQICADAVVRVGQLQVDESLVTGEPDPVEKNPGDELMAGSFVVAGRGTVQLIRVGDDSYAARLAREARKDPKTVKSEMMRDLDRLIRFLSIILIPLGLLYFMGEYISAVSDPKNAAEHTVAALVSMIPQGLYLLTSIALAASALKLSRQKVLVQDVNCIETLARTDVLCVDKTGTITESAMQVEELIPLCGARHAYLEKVLGALYGTEEPENETARALAEIYPNESGWECLRRIPFTSKTKWSGAVFAREGAFLTGAPAFILGSRYEEVRHLVTPWTEKGYRVLLTAGYEGDPEPGRLDPDRVTPLALILLTSRIRESAAESFRYFAEQGVTIKVLSGDDPRTASDVASRAGIMHADLWVDCAELHTEKEYLAAAERFTVFGRVTPEKKRELIRALRKQRHTVAMVGDGVNDVLAMREANCAVAMAGGAQAASWVAQMVLVEPDFSAMPGIVGEGRRVMGNIRRAAALFLVKNVFTMALVLLSLLTALVYPFQPGTLTLVMALTVGIPSFFLALEPNYERMTGAFLRGALGRALPGGLVSFVTVVLAQLVANRLAMDETQLATVCASVLAVVGLLVLWQVSRPMTKLRKAVLAAMSVALVLAFLLVGRLFGIDVYDGQTTWVMLLMIAVAAVLYGAVMLLMHKRKK